MVEPLYKVIAMQRKVKPIVRRYVFTQLPCALEFIRNL